MLTADDLAVIAFLATHDKCAETYAYMTEHDTDDAHVMDACCFLRAAGFSREVLADCDGPALLFWAETDADIDA